MNRIFILLLALTTAFIACNSPEKEKALEQIRISMENDPRHAGRDVDEIIAKRFGKDWKVIATGGDAGKCIRNSPNPRQCPDGINFTSHGRDLHTGKRRPAPEECWAVITYPDESIRGCEAPCAPIAFDTCRSYYIWQNVKSGEYAVSCYKYTRFECKLDEIMEQ